MKGCWDIEMVSNDSDNLFDAYPVHEHPVDKPGGLLHGESIGMVEAASSGDVPGRRRTLAKECA